MGMRSDCCKRRRDLSDPVVAFGVNGVEYFAHAWEFGFRKAKEILLRRENLAGEARSCGMVNHVVPRMIIGFHRFPRTEYIQATQHGTEIGQTGVNQSQDAQGFWSALQSAMSLQQLGHANNEIVHGIAVDPSGASIIKKRRKVNRDLLTPGKVRFPFSRKALNLSEIFAGKDRLENHKMIDCRIVDSSSPMRIIRLVV